MTELNLLMMSRNKVTDLTPLVKACEGGRGRAEAVRPVPAAVPGRQPALRRGQEGPARRAEEGRGPGVRGVTRR